MPHLDEGMIHAWIEGELAPEENEQVERHVGVCDECAAAVAEARGIIAASTRILTHLDGVPGSVAPGAGEADAGGAAGAEGDEGRPSGPRRESTGEMSSLIAAFRAASGNQRAITPPGSPSLSAEAEEPPSPLARRLTGTKPVLMPVQRETKRATRAVKRGPQTTVWRVAALLVVALGAGTVIERGWFPWMGATIEERVTGRGGRAGANAVASAPAAAQEQAAGRQPIAGATPSSPTPPATTPALQAAGKQLDRTGTSAAPTSATQVAAAAPPAAPPGRDAAARGAPANVPAAGGLAKDERASGASARADQLASVADAQRAENRTAAAAAEPALRQRPQAATADAAKAGAAKAAGELKTAAAPPAAARPNESGAVAASGAAAAPAPVSAPPPLPAPAWVVGCYEPKVAAWSMAPDPTQATFITPPSRFILSDTPVPGGGIGLRRFAVRTAADAAATPHTAAWWMPLGGDSVLVTWSAGSKGLRFRLGRSGDALHGTAMTFWDTGDPSQYAEVTARRVTCK